MTKERELKEAVREGRDRVSIFDFFFFWHICLLFLEEASRLLFLMENVLVFTLDPKTL